MSLRIVYGRAGSGKSRFCLNEIKKQIEYNSDTPIVLIVPEQFSFQAEKELVSVMKSRGILRNEVLSFCRLAYRVFNEEGGITYPHIHNSGKSMIIYRILEEINEKFIAFSKIKDKQGFVQTICKLITELKKYNITPENLEECLSKIENNEELRQKINEIYDIYSKFENELSKRYTDPDDDLSLVTLKIEKSNIFDNTHFWIDGFTGFTPQEYEIIGCIMKKAKMVTITLCLDKICQEDEKIKDTDVFFSVKKSYKNIINIAKKMNIEIESPIYLDRIYKFENNQEILHLERYYNSYPYKIYENTTKNISLCSYMNMFSEVEYTAKEIIKLCRDENYRYKDIAVVTRNIGEYQKLIEIIFSEYEIPYFIDKKIDIIDNALIRFVISMLEIFTENWSYEAIFRYLKTGMSNLEYCEIDKIENYVLACGIKGSKWIIDKPWEMIPEFIPNEKNSEKNISLLNEINSIRQKVVMPLMSFRNKTKGKKSAREFCSNLYDFLCNLNIPQKLEKNIINFRKQGKMELASEYSQVWDLLMDFFDQIVEVMGNEEVGITKFLNIFKIGISEYKVGIIPMGMDQVFVGTVERSKSYNIKALYIIGVNDGVFPAKAGDEGLLSDSDRKVLASKDIFLAEDTKTQSFAEQFLVYNSLTIPTQILRISWPIADLEGKTLRPSIIISRIKKLFPKVEQKSKLILNSKEKEFDDLSSKPQIFKELIYILKRKMYGETYIPVWEDIYKWFSSDTEWKQRCEYVKEALKYKNNAQSINKKRILSLYGNPTVASVSRLEKYTACPFGFYVQYGLGAKERKIYRLSPPDIGTFLHAVIDVFSQMVSEGEITWRTFEREWCEQKVSEIIDDMLLKMQGAILTSSKRYVFLIKRLKRVVARTMWIIAEHIRNSAFNPVGYEIGFGDNDTFPPIEIELSTGEKIKLTGRIDRIDKMKTEDGEYLRIIDYKSGSKDFKLADVFYGLQIQLITYLDAIWDNEDKNSKKITPAGILYFKVDDPIIKGEANLTEEEIEKEIMKKLKMKGLILADVKLIKEMDKTIQGSSLFIPATLNKGDVIGHNTSGATNEQFNILRRYIKKLLNNLCKEIVNGNVAISPYKKKSTTSCTYCKFLSICQFNSNENKFRVLQDKKDEEVWELITKDNN